MKRSLTTVAAVDLFCGAGGLTYGLRRAGIDVRAGIDIDPACQYPYTANNQALFINKSINQVDVDDVTGFWTESSYTLLAGCAPCQPFSSYMQGRVDQTDVRWNLLDEFSRLVEQTKPDFVTMENVPRLQEQQVFKSFLKQLEDSGYKSVSVQVVNCSDYGVPQNRKRLVLLASKHGDLRLVPVKTKSKKKTVRDAIGMLPAVGAGETCISDELHESCSLSPKNLKRIRASKQGKTWKEWPMELVSECHSKPSGSTYSSVYGRMRWDEPSPTITTQFYGFGNGRFGHPEQHRAISFREGAILQSFPLGYKFCAPGTRVPKRALGRMIGNAVPVKLGEVIGKSILKHISDIEKGLLQCIR
ncbi:MAG TPA: DNA cytosine methyltransferase [Candidatus Didemnitutus sp.]|nr:DNA cytosine methyltransferase [Candidatus Didemnitutus sp.]